MSYVKIMIHAVWATKHREHILEKTKREVLFGHIKENAIAKRIYIDTIGGHTDHVHCLISLSADQNIAKVIQLLKGESSYWANRKRLILPKLIWADDYYAASVDESRIQIVRAYITSQDEHHKKVSFEDEYKSLLKASGFNFG